MPLLLAANSGLAERVIGDTSEEDNLAPLMIEDFGFNSPLESSPRSTTRIGTTYLSERDATLNEPRLNTSTALGSTASVAPSRPISPSTPSFDKQQLNISVQLPFDLPMSKASLVARAEHGSSFRRPRAATYRFGMSTASRRSDRQR